MCSTLLVSGDRIPNARRWKIATTDIFLLATSSLNPTQTNDISESGVFPDLTTEIASYPAMGSLSDYIVQTSDDFFLASTFMSFGDEGFSRCFDDTFSL